MEGRPNRGRGGSWKRGGHGGNDSENFGSERRGRGRGGRGKKDHRRGRGRGGDTHASTFRHTNQNEDDEFHVEEQRTVFSKRTLESNWDRYEDSEKQEADDDMPTQRGIDYHVLLASAGDSFTQFRLSEEKDWEKDTLSCSQMSAHFVDLEALALSLQHVPLNQRLNLEGEVLQVSTPVEFPTMTSKQEMPKFTPMVSKVPNKNKNPNISKSISLSASSDSQGPSGPAAPVALLADDVDEDLDHLLTLAKPVCDVSGDQCNSLESVAPLQKEYDAVTDEVIEEKTEEPKDNVVTHPEAVNGKQEMTEENLEDWLDSMIS